ncbi:MAG: GNAT family N-acetyltransferase [Cyclobacteriaceae bacterium]
MIEVIETPRLLLREFEMEDAPSLYKLNLDPQVIQFTGDNAFSSIEEARAFLRNYDHYQTYGYGRWAVTLRTERTFIGWCGLKYHIETQEVDLGFRFMRKFWRNGYASEAGSACIKFAFQPLKMKRLIGRVMPENVASIKLLEKVGMTFYHRMKIDSKEWLVYEIVNQP